MEFKILTSELLDQYREALTESPLEKLDKIKKPDMPVDYFQFLSLDFLLMTVNGIETEK